MIGFGGSFLKVEYYENIDIRQAVRIYVIMLVGILFQSGLDRTSRWEGAFPMKDVFRLGLTLMVICALAGLGLSVVYEKTKPVIAEREREDILKAAMDCIPGSDTIEELEADGVTYWLGKKGNVVTGGAVKVEAGGYGSSPVVMMIGVDSSYKIYKIKIISLSETPGIGTKITSDDFLARFEGTDEPFSVDGITGATSSSGAVKSGAVEGLQFLSAIMGKPAPGGEINLEEIPDGIYEGTGMGRNGPIKVTVELRNGKITSVSVVEHEETPRYAAMAIPDIPNAIVLQQRLNVDAVSGATLTSNGIVEAVNNALQGQIQ